MKTRVLITALIVLQSITSAEAQELEYYAVFLEGTKVGYATHERIAGDDKVTTTETMSMTINRAGIEITVKTKETCVESADGAPISFANEQDIGLGTTRTEGTVGRDGIVQVQTKGMGEVQKDSFAWPKGAVMAEGLRLLEMSKKLNEGTGYEVNIFSPELMAAVLSRVKVGARQDVDLLGRIVTLTKVETAMSMPGTGEITTTSFVDDKLNMLKSIMPTAGMSVELVACPKEYALTNNEPAEIVDKMFLASPGPIENIDSARSITYYLKPIEGTGNFIIPAAGSQRVERLDNGMVKVTVEPVNVIAGGPLPYKGTDKELLDAIKPSRYLQSDDPKIIELARRAVGNAKDSAEAARKIESFVADYVEDRSLSVGYASASEVAASKKGDCTEFAVLSAAMCRAAGIPAKVVMGVAYVDDFAGRSGFGGHAWTQVYTGGKWVGLDSTFKAGGKKGFDAGHIAFAMGNGEPADFFNIATTLGRFKIEKIMVNSSK
jgi:hypothetical protein